MKTQPKTKPNINIKTQANMKPSIQLIQHDIEHSLNALKLTWIRDHYNPLVEEHIQKSTTPRELLKELFAGEYDKQQQRSIENRIRLARFPVIKSMDDFKWDWPEKIDRNAIENLFDLNFVNNKANAIFIGGVGTGKSHIATALGIKACQKGYRVLWTDTVTALNELLHYAQKSNLKEALKKYQKPDLLILDELGYLPVDKKGCDLLFQIISQRYEKASTIITTNKAYKDWSSIFNNDDTVTSAVLDRLIHYCHTNLIEGPSFRMKQKIKGA
jgi:DNA replication protein DnaC